MAPSFVILEHVGHGPAHYDLMLEEGAALATWQLDRAVADLPAGEGFPSRKLPDHRLEYLAYEGPVSRGRVRRLEAGTYDLLRAEEGLWEVRLNGSTLCGRFEFRHVGPEADRWQLRRLSDDLPERCQASGGTGEATGPGLGR